MYTQAKFQNFPNLNEIQDLYGNLASSHVAHHPLLYLLSCWLRIYSPPVLHDNLGVLSNVFQGTSYLFNILSDEAGYSCKLSCSHPRLPACQWKRLYRQAHILNFFMFSWQTGLPHMTFVLARS
jgi:hypothetical protein